LQNTSPLRRELAEVVARLYDLLRGGRGDLVCINKRKLGISGRGSVAWDVLRDWLRRHADMVFEKSGKKREFCFQRGNKLRVLAVSMSKSEFVEMLVEMVIADRPLKVSEERGGES